ncbi:MAG: hypothetical protein II885_17355 [Oscillospiraceae bacterium]|nr:hypothetical protein [Oscillospiraceae bacterium]
MPNTSNTKNYFAHGGNELVVGGRLTFLDGAEIVNFPKNLLPETGSGDSTGAAYIPDSTATTVAALREDFNTLLNVLRSAGTLKDSPEKQAGDGDAG